MAAAVVSLLATVAPVSVVAVAVVVVVAFRAQAIADFSNRTSQPSATVSSKLYRPKDLTTPLKLSPLSNWIATTLPSRLDAAHMVSSGSTWRGFAPLLAARVDANSGFAPIVGFAATPVLGFTLAVPVMAGFTAAANATVPVFGSRLPVLSAGFTLAAGAAGGAGRNAASCSARLARIPPTLPCALVSCRLVIETSREVTQPGHRLPGFSIRPSVSNHREVPFHHPR